jgi:hypothetical protein
VKQKISSTSTGAFDRPTGSFAYGDSAAGIAFGVTKNRLTPDFSAATQLIQIVTNTGPRA